MSRRAASRRARSAVCLGWQTSSTATCGPLCRDRRPRGACRVPVLRPRGRPCTRLGPCRGCASSPRRPRSTRPLARGHAVALRLSPDDVLLIDPTRPSSRGRRPDAIVIPDTASPPGAGRPGREPLLPTHRAWPLPARRPALAAGRARRLPGKPLCGGRRASSARRPAPCAPGEGLQERLAGAAVNEFVEPLLDLPWQPSRSARYDVVIIGGGGHGLATAYYLAAPPRHHRRRGARGGYIGSGNSGRTRPSSAPTTGSPSRSVLPAQPRAVRAARGGDRPLDHAHEQGPALAGPLESRARRSSARA